MMPATAREILERMLECQQLVALVQRQAAKLSPQKAIPASLAVGVKLLSTRLGEWSGDDGLQRILEAASSNGGCFLATKLRSIYCEGSLFTRLCTRDAMLHDPVTVGFFLLGVNVMATVLPTATVDYASLKDLACYLDSHLAQAGEAPIASEEGTGAFTTLHFLRQMCVGAIAACITDPRTPEHWRMDAASPALEPMLHLALGQLSTACQLVVEQQSGLAEALQEGSMPLGQTKQPGSPLLSQEHKIAGHAVRVVSQLAFIAVEAANMGALSLQCLVGCGADLVEVLDHYPPQDRHLTSLQSKMLGPAIYGLSTVLQLQLIALDRLRGPGLSRAQKSALKDVLDQRMHWVGAATAFAKVLHCVADAAGGSRSTAQQWCLDSELPEVAFKGLEIVNVLMQNVYMGRYEPGLPSDAVCIGQPGGFAMVPGAVGPLLELAELLLRLVAKQPALAGFWVTSDPEQKASAELPLLAVLSITTDLTDAAVIQVLGGAQQGPPEQSGKVAHSNRSTASNSSKCSSSSRNNSSGGDLAPEDLLWKVVSLAVTAAKFGRCLPAIPPGPMRSSSLAFFQLNNVKHVAAMCCSVLACSADLTEAPGPQHSLTHHLRSTGFLPFLCLPALAEAMGCPDLQAKHLMTADGNPHTFVRDLLVQLREHRVIDDAVRAGSLGPLLRHYLLKLLGLGSMCGATTILLELGEQLEAEHTEAVALTVGKDGVLQVTADKCLSLVRGHRIEKTE